MSFSSPVSEREGARVKFGTGVENDEHTWTRSGNGRDTGPRTEEMEGVPLFLPWRSKHGEVTISHLFNGTYHTPYQKPDTTCELIHHQFKQVLLLLLLHYVGRCKGLENLRGSCGFFCSKGWLYIMPTVSVVRGVTYPNWIFTRSLNRVTTGLFLLLRSTVQSRWDVQDELRLYVLKRPSPWRTPCYQNTVL